MYLPKGLKIDIGMSGRVALYLSTQESEQHGHGNNKKEGRWKEEAQLEAWCRPGGGWDSVLGPAHKSNSPRQHSLLSGRCRKSQ